jgi:hypothetical protein
MIRQDSNIKSKGDKVMKQIKVLSVLSGLMILFVGNAFATTSSQILVMSNQLYQIAKDLTTGMLPTAILLIAIGLWGIANAFGKNIGDGLHQLTNIIAVGGIVFFASSLLVNAAMFSSQM